MTALTDTVTLANGVEIPSIGTGQISDGGDHRAGNLAAWSALEEIHEAGRSRSIGVSNFTVADRYDPSVAQLSLRCVVQKGVLPLLKTTAAAGMAENAAMDFEISESDRASLDGLTDTTK